MDDLEDVLNELNFENTNNENYCCLNNMSGDSNNIGAFGALEEQLEGPITDERNPFPS